MRNLKKTPIPAILSEKGETWLAEFHADRSSRTKRYRYRDPSIKSALVNETGSKCIYCESKIGHNTPGDVEHKVPTSKVPEKHFEWSNLTIACTECNRRKDDRYDEGGFLDPYNDDVEKCLIHLGPLIHWVPGHNRAEKAVRTLGLDSMERRSLIDRKKETLDKVRSLLGNVKVAGDAMMQELRKDELSRMGEVDSEYSMMVLTYLGQAGEA